MLKHGNSVLGIEGERHSCVWSPVLEVALTDNLEKQRMATLLAQIEISRQPPLKIN